jgi:hypothetical protein
MPGMDLPQPGGTMKKMSFEFADPAAAEAQAQQGAPQIPQGAGIPPSGMQNALPPTGMQGTQAPMLTQMGQQGPPDDGGFSNMLSDEDLAMMQDGTDLEGQQLADASMDPMNPQAQDIQQQLMMAARRRLGY